LADSLIRRATEGHGAWYCPWRISSNTDRPTVSKVSSRAIATVGYGSVAINGTRDDYYLICEECFRVFNPIFHWEVIAGEGMGG
jgi:hypothetical protein